MTRDEEAIAAAAFDRIALRSFRDGAATSLLEDHLATWMEAWEEATRVERERTSTATTVDLDAALAAVAAGKKVSLVYTNGPRAGMNIEIYDPVQLSQQSEYLKDYTRGEAVLKSVGVNVDGRAEGSTK